MTDVASDSVTSVCRDGDVSETVIAAVAEATDTDPLDLEPLYTVVDPDALNGLVRQSVGSPSSSVEINFSMAGCDVTVHGDGEVIVTPSTAHDGGEPTIARRGE